MVRTLPATSALHLQTQALKKAMLSISIGRQCCRSGHVQRRRPAYGIHRDDCLAAGWQEQTSRHLKKVVLH